MAVTFVTPVDVTPGSTSAWTDVDLDSFIGGLSGVTGVILRCNNTDTSNSHAFGLRKNGSTDNRTDSLRRSGLQGAIIGVDGGNIFEAFIANTSVKIYAVGYITSTDGAFSTNATQKSVASGSWQDVDISGDTGADTAIAAIFEWTAAVAYGQRKNGSTDNRVISAQSHFWSMAGCDGSEITEVFRTSGGNNPWLIGYLKSGATLNTNATDRSLGSTGSWTNITTAGGAGAIFEVVDTGSDNSFGIRKDGSSETVTGFVGGSAHCWFFCESAASVVEGNIDSTLVDFYEVGTFDSGGVSGTIAVTLANFTSTISGTTTVNGTIAVTLANHTSAISGTTTVVGTIAAALANFTSAISGSTMVSGTIAALLAAFTSAISGTTTVVGTIAASLENLTSAISGTVGDVAAAGRWIVRQIGLHLVTACRYLTAGVRRNRNNG